MHHYYTVPGSQEHKTEEEKSYANRHVLCDALFRKFQEQAELTYSGKKKKQNSGAASALGLVWSVTGNGHKRTWGC